MEEICEVVADSSSEIVLVRSGYELLSSLPKDKLHKHYLLHLKKYVGIMRQRGKIVGIQLKSPLMKNIAPLLSEVGLDFIKGFIPSRWETYLLSETGVLRGKAVIWISLPKIMFSHGRGKVCKYASELIRNEMPRKV